MFTQMIGKNTYVETERVDLVLVKLKTCLCIKSRFYESNFFNTDMC